MTTTKPKSVTPRELRWLKTYHGRKQVAAFFRDDTLHVSYRCPRCSNIHEKPYSTYVLGEVCDHRPDDSVLETLEFEAPNLLEDSQRRLRKNLKVALNAVAALDNHDPVLKRQGLVDIQKQTLRYLGEIFETQQTRIFEALDKNRVSTLRTGTVASLEDLGFSVVLKGSEIFPACRGAVCDVRVRGKGTDFYATLMTADDWKGAEYGQAFKSTRTTFDQILSLAKEAQFCGLNYGVLLWNERRNLTTFIGIEGIKKAAISRGLKPRLQTDHLPKRLALDTPVLAQMRGKPSLRMLDRIPPNKLVQRRNRILTYEANEEVAVTTRKDIVTNRRLAEILREKQESIQERVRAEARLERTQQRYMNLRTRKERLRNRLLIEIEDLRARRRKLRERRREIAAAFREADAQQRQAEKLIAEAQRRSNSTYLEQSFALDREYRLMMHEERLQQIFEQSHKDFLAEAEEQCDDLRAYIHVAENIGTTLMYANELIDEQVRRGAIDAAAEFQKQFDQLEEWRAERRAVWKEDRARFAKEKVEHEKYLREDEALRLRIRAKAKRDAERVLVRQLHNLKEKEYALHLERMRQIRQDEMRKLRNFKKSERNIQKLFAAGLSAELAEELGTLATTLEALMGEYATLQEQAIARRNYLVTALRPSMAYVNFTARQTEYPNAKLEDFTEALELAKKDFELLERRSTQMRRCEAELLKRWTALRTVLNADSKTKKCGASRGELTPQNNTFH